MDRDAAPTAAPRDEVASVGVLAEPHRRALYDHVVGQRGWVSREQAAAALGLGRGITAHHLDRLADEGLLETDSQRVNDRRGPGAGRPAKVYRRAPAELTVSLPPRHYELAAQLLAEAVERCQRDGTPIDRAIDGAARRAGRTIGAETQQALGRRSATRARRNQLFAELCSRGYEPETLDTGTTILHNCPFHRLARRHTELICGMNLGLLDSLLTELGGTELRAVLEPENGHCCIRFHPATETGGEGCSEEGTDSWPL